MWDIVFLILVVGFLIIISYTLGLKNGQKLRNDERIELPKIAEPIKNIAESFKETFDSEKLSEDEQFDWDNINNYNGTNESQKHI